MSLIPFNLVVVPYVRRVVSKDRESNESGSGMRFRNHSPSTTNRRSRDREPRAGTSEKAHWERDADANTMLITNESSPAIGSNAANTTATAASGESNDQHALDDSAGMFNDCFFYIVLLYRSLANEMRLVR